MHLHILGICGTFMGSLALLARECGHRVTGSDANVYPPMSTLLAAQGIEIREGFEPAHLEPTPDVVVVGNAMSRGNAAVEAMLDRGLRYTSGPQWLADHVLDGRHVLAVSGTHGKTTTTSMLAWILEDNGLAPGFLIGGVPADFPVSARLGSGAPFVIEADEYDTAFFDKRSKFVHYRPRTLVINNLEYDHADIFANLAAIQTQFHHLVRTVPGSGRILAPSSDTAIAEVLDRGCWTPVETVGFDAGDWRGRAVAGDGSAFEVWRDGRHCGSVAWSLLGHHNVANALVAVAAAADAGVDPAAAAASLARFRGVKRRLEVIGAVADIVVYDDFAHHPSAIEATLGALGDGNSGSRLIALIEPRSNTMKAGVHRDRLAAATARADRVFWYRPADLDFELATAVGADERHQVIGDIDALVAAVVAEARRGDRIVVMSNGAFGGIHARLLDALHRRAQEAGFDG